MKLKQAELKNRQQWTEKGYALPAYDREKVAENTKRAPTWIHFGGGNIFRIFPAAALQRVLDSGAHDKGVIVAEGFDYEIIEKAYRPYDNLSLAVTLKADGSVQKTVIGSVVESLVMDQASSDWARLKEIFAAPSLQMASFTITEKGYALKNGAGEYLPFVEKDFRVKPEEAGSYIGKLTALCYHRYLNGKYPLALVSMDNCSHNGEKLYNAVTDYARHWTESGAVEPGFLAYITDPKCVAFPWSMIDKITPRPDAQVEEILKADGFEDTAAVITSKRTYTAAFVNAEETEYLVVEDTFPNGRPPLDKGGVIFTDRETVNKTEKMKVCTCLNPVHTALSIFGCLLGYNLICKEMELPELKKLVETLSYKEGMPVVVDPKIMDPKAFASTVINVRVTNPFMPDSPQRIVTDTSQKLSIRFGETIKAYMAREDLDVQDLKMIPLVFAGFCRYILGVDDKGEPMEQSGDPMLEELKNQLSAVKLGDKGPFSEALKPILSNDKIFGVDLYTVGLGERTERYFEELAAGPGAVLATLKKYVK